MRLKYPAQPLVFCFPGVTPLCSAVAKLYAVDPALKGSLCLYRGRYFLAVYSRLNQRSRAFRAAAEFGAYCGPGRVLYAYLEEHGYKISGNAVAELGLALTR